MAKKILIVEQSLAVRGIAESLLRQNGYDVVAADSVEAARSAMHDIKFDLMLISSQMSDAQGRPFYDTVNGLPEAAPFLLLHDPATGRELPFPPEVIIQKPFIPRDFMTAIEAFTAGEDQGESPVSVEPADFEDDLIDAALGLNNIEVSGSEVFGDDTSSFRVRNQKVTTGNMLGYEYREANDDTIRTIKKTAEINIPSHGVAQAGSEPTDKSAGKEDANKREFLGQDSAKVKKPTTPQLSESSKIEIVPDQYGIVSHQDLTPPENPDQSHDYNWFISELKKENAPTGLSPGQPSSPGVNALAKAPGSTARPPSAEPPRAKSSPFASPAHSEAVDKFISEFKKEMEKISDDIVPDIPVTNIPVTAESPLPEPAALAWQDSLTGLSEPELDRLADKMVEIIAEKVAQKIASLLDPKIVRTILQETVREYLHSRHLRAGK